MLGFVLEPTENISNTSNNLVPCAESEDSNSITKESILLTTKDRIKYSIKTVLSLLIGTMCTAYILIPTALTSLIFLIIAEVRYAKSNIKEENAYYRKSNLWSNVTISIYWLIFLLYLIGEFIISIRPQ